MAYLMNLVDYTQTLKYDSLQKKCEVLDNADRHMII